jgi:hypothetical protein
MTYTVVDLVENAVKSIQEEDGKPFYSYNTWPEEADRLTQLNKQVTSEDTKFPLVFLKLPITESFEESEKMFESELSIFIIGRTKSKYNSEYRHKNEMPALRTIETNVLSALNARNVRFTDYDREEVLYAEFNNNEPVNFIELTIPVKYSINCLT